MGTHCPVCAWLTPGPFTEPKPGQNDCGLNSIQGELVLPPYGACRTAFGCLGVDADLPQASASCHVRANTHALCLEENNR